MFYYFNESDAKEKETMIHGKVEKYTTEGVITDDRIDVGYDYNVYLGGGLSFCKGCEIEDNEIKVFLFNPLSGDIDVYIEKVGVIDG